MTFPISPGVIAAEAQGTAAVAGAAKKATGVLGGDLGDVTDGIRAVRAWVSSRHNWVRVSWFLSGAAMFTVGVVLLGERPIAQGAEGVATVAKILPK